LFVDDQVHRVIEVEVGQVVHHIAPVGGSGAAGGLLNEFDGGLQPVGREALSRLA
jgi:hypothetical protein